MGPGNPPKPTGDPGGTWTALAGRGIPEGSTTDGTVRDSFLLPSGTPRWPEVVKPSVEENDYQGVHDAMRAKGMSPAWINAYTIDKGPFYFYTFFTVVFRPGLGADQPTFHGLDAAGYQQRRSRWLRGARISPKWNTARDRHITHSRRTPGFAELLHLLSRRISHVEQRHHYRKPPGR
jgi:hypothetical protein